MAPNNEKSFAYKQDTEIAVSRIFSLGERGEASGLQQSCTVDADCVSMNTMGQLGRYGNQVLQYMFLNSLASRNGVSHVCPDWVGNHIFGLPTPRSSTTFAPAVENLNSKSNSSFGPMFLDHVNGAAGGNCPVVSMESLDEANDDLINKDIVGWFQGHTKHFVPFKENILSALTPVPEVKSVMDEAVGKIRERGKTLVVVHLRLGDYKNIPVTSFGYMAPLAWYVSLLRVIWPLLEEPVLYVASDDVPAVKKTFAAFDPISMDDVVDGTPEVLQSINAGFFLDHYVIQNADVAAISNSTFSFTACMLNQRPKAKFFRPHWSENMVQFDPWNDYPVLHRRGAVVGTLTSALAVVAKTQGMSGLITNCFWEIPSFYTRIAVMHTVLACRRMWRRGLTVQS